MDKTKGGEDIGSLIECLNSQHENPHSKMKKIAVIGSGTMGNGIAHVFAQNGYDVNLVDIRQDALDRALATIAKNLDRQINKERITEDDKQATLANIQTFTSLAEGR